MAGVKGRSGGPRANSGGARPNSGPKPRPKTTDIGQALATVVAAQAPKPAPKVPPKIKAAVPPAPDQTSPLEFLLAVMRNPAVDDKLRIEAAKTAAPYLHPKKGEGGKKDEQLDAAKQAGKGRFAAAQAPLRMVK